MLTPLPLLRERCSHAFIAALSDLLEPTFTAEVAVSGQPQFGHYQCNSALKVGKLLGKNPRELALAVVKELERDPLLQGFLGKVEVAGAGFINLSLSAEALAEGVHRLLSDPVHLGIQLPKRQRVIVEFSSPNVAKELHVGHLRSTIIGDALARLFEFLGHDVLRLNHIGDWGTQFGMLIAYLKSEGRSSVEGMTLSDLMHCYKESKQRFDHDPAFKKRAQQEVVQLQGGDPEARQFWEAICEISRQAFQEIYRLLDVKLTERGESFYNPMLAPLVAELTEKGLITTSDGAKCIFMEGFDSREGTPLPMIVQKADGGFNYDTTDMAALKHRVQVEQADRIIYVTDAGQSLHFQMLFVAGRLAGYWDPLQVRLDHVPFGVVLGADGKKFKTRSGETEKLIDLLTEAVLRARTVLEEKVGDNLSSAEKDQLAQVLGIDSVKYADLCCHRVKDYLFSYDRMLRFEGNTAPFLLYAYVRCFGIQRRIEAKGGALDLSAKIALSHPSEIALALHMLRFEEAIGAVAEELLPNRLTDYLFTLAELFHAFFRDCRVEGSEQQSSRLLLCEATARLLRQGLQLLGLKVVERM